MYYGLKTSRILLMPNICYAQLDDKTEKGAKSPTKIYHTFETNMVYNS